MFTDFSMDEMNETLNLNVTAAFFTMTAFLELLDAGNKNALQSTDSFGSPASAGQSGAPHPEPGNLHDERFRL